MKHRILARVPVTIVGSVAASLLLLFVNACASADQSASAPENAGATYPGGAGYAGYANTGGSTGDFTVPYDAGAIVTPEVQVEKTFEAPVATGKYVWSANPQTGQVARISAETYEVATVAAGSGPKYLAAVPGDLDRAIVLNEFSNDATLLTAVAGGAIDKRTFRVATGANSWAISPDGRWAVAWADATKVTNADSTQGFQTISVIDLSTVNLAVPSAAVAESSRLIVGYRPMSVGFAAAKKRAFAVTADGIDVIDLAATGGPARIKTIKWTTACTQVGPVDQPDASAPDAAAPVEAGVPDAAAEGGSDAEAGAPPVVQQPEASAPAAPPTPGSPVVTITADGSYAIYRRDFSRDVVAVDLAAYTCAKRTLGGFVTGMEVPAAGTQAVAVVRELSEVNVMAVPSLDLTARNVIDGEIVGSVVMAADGKTLVLYTNAVAVPRMTVATLGPTFTYRAVQLHAPVLAVYPTPDASYAVLLHKSFGGTAFTKPGAIGVVPLAEDLAGVIQATDAPPQYVAVSPDSKSALVSVRDDTTRVYAVYRPRMPSLDIQKMTLASPPMSVGVVGGVSPPVGFIAQEHPAGRITFVDLANPEIVARTITGFELGARVVEWPAASGGTQP